MEQNDIYVETLVASDTFLIFLYTEKNFYPLFSSLFNFKFSFIIGAKSFFNSECPTVSDSSTV